MAKAKWQGHQRIPIGSLVTIHELANSGFDYTFKTQNGRVSYTGMGYPNRASGNWVLVSRLIKQSKNEPIKHVIRRLKWNTIVKVTGHN